MALTIVAGLSLLVSGVRLFGTTYRVLGQGLIGGGIATLYLSVYAAQTYYHLIGPSTAFALMGLVTVCAGVLAVRFDSMLVAVLGIIGGVWHAGHDRDGRGELRRPVFLHADPGMRHLRHQPEEELAPAQLSRVRVQLRPGDRGSRNTTRTSSARVMPFFAAFFVLYSTTLFVFCVVHRTKSTLLELLGLMLNAGIFLAVSYRLVEPIYGHRAMAIVTLGLTAFYTATCTTC